jgi:hypothetical protein
MELYTKKWPLVKTVLILTILLTGRHSFTVPIIRAPKLPPASIAIIRAVYGWLSRSAPLTATIVSYHGRSLWDCVICSAACRFAMKFLVVFIILGLMQTVISCSRYWPAKIGASRSQPLHVSVVECCHSHRVHGQARRVAVLWGSVVAGAVMISWKPEVAPPSYAGGM